MPLYRPTVPTPRGIKIHPLYLRALGEDDAFSVKLFHRPGHDQMEPLRLLWNHLAVA